ncbi:MAG TPA: MFS transporter [Ktedonobacterales bacterium]|nr:MFS transporter [Ktedonobacterales bacterium]
MGGLRSWVGSRRMALPRYSRNVYLILLFTLGKGFQIYIGQVTINLYAYSLGYPKDFIGMLSAMPALGSLLAAIPIGLLADRIGRKPLLLVSGFLNPLALAAVALSTASPTLLGASFLNGVLASAYWVTVLPILTESTTDDQQVGVLAINSFLLLGVGALGSLVGGLVPEAVAALIHQPALSPVPLRFGVLAAATVTFLPAIPLFALETLPSPRAAAEAPPPATTNAEHAAPPPAAPQRMERKALVTLFGKLLLPDLLATTGEGTVIGLLQLYFVLRFHMQPGSLGALFTLAGLVGGATALNAPRIVRRWGKLKTATTMQYLSAPAMLLTGLAPVLPLAAAGEFSRIVLRGLFDPTYASFTMEQVSARYRATLSGCYSVTWSLGFSIGPTLAGWLYEHLGSLSTFIVGAVCLASSATLLRLFFGGFSRSSRPPTGETAPAAAIEGAAAPAH